MQVNSKRWSWIAVGALGAGLSVAMFSTAVASEMGQAAADQVSLASYQGFLNTSLYTHNGNSRGPAAPQHNLARNNILALFQSYGLSASLEPFTYSGQSGNNVVATLVGTTYPSQIYVIAGHYDSANTPGADDNASGVALVLEAARILSQYDSAYTIKFIAFDLEELGLYGSAAYCNAHPADDVRGMISLDMVCYDPNTNHALLYGRTASNPIKNAVGAAVAEYAGGLTYTIGGQVDQSDHASFESHGWQACLLIEGEVWNNPYYHTSQDSYDSPGYLNFGYATKMTRSIVGWLVDTAGVDVPVNTLEFAYPNGRPEYSFPNGTTTVRVTVGGLGNAVPQPGTGLLHYNLGGGWQIAPMLVVTDNVYDAVLPAAPCGTIIQYYFSAQAVGGQTYVDPHYAPTTTYSATAAYALLTVYENSLDTSPGWTTQGQWAFGHPTGGGSHDHDPSNGHTGSNVYGYNLSGDYASGIPAYYLTTTPFDCTGKYHTRFEFWRWLGVESDSNYDKATVEVSNNGTTWAVLWRAYDTGGAVSDSSWVFQSFDISAVADNQSAVRIRWSMGPADSYVTYPGWNIDDVRLTALECAVPQIKGDLNCDGVLNFGDINPFVLALQGYDAYHALYPDCYWLNADCNDDGVVNFADINAFVALLGG
jgi:Zn-dependent M28 family amino/carboxypeptidase